jgi:dihydrofolate synthase / folylpolyglutamate synthase
MSANPRPQAHRADWSYDEALRFWYGHINFEQRSPQPSDLKLDRMRELLVRLGNPHEDLRIVHVAGSKGKGSTSAMLAAILRHAGYRVGLFTSPHLSRVEERIQVDGEPIHAVELAALLWEVRQVLEQPPSDLHPTFFEIATALGFLHFRRREVDVAVIEVGLGGRFDSTNVCTPEVALITSISLDHTRQLGNRLASIAFEKAGIVKAGRPAVSGVATGKARDVIENVCRERHAPLFQLGRDFDFRYQPGLASTDPAGPPFQRWPGVQVTTRRQEWPWMQLGLLGEHQAANAAVAIACIEQLTQAGWRVRADDVADGLARVQWPARLEIVGRRPLVVLDCAHNAASARALVEALEASFPAKHRALLFAASNDKDIPAIFRVLAPHFEHAFLTRYSDSPRSVPPDDLATMLRQTASLSCSVHADAPGAWRAALARAGPEDLICITGSVFLAGELRRVCMQR